jgi:hypothetical protein
MGQGLGCPRERGEKLAGSPMSLGSVGIVSVGNSRRSSSTRPSRIFATWVGGAAKLRRVRKSVSPGNSASEAPTHLSQPASQSRDSVCKSRVRSLRVVSRVFQFCGRILLRRFRSLAQKQSNRNFPVLGKTDLALHGARPPSCVDRPDYQGASDTGDGRLDLVGPYIAAWLPVMSCQKGVEPSSLKICTGELG